MAERNRALTIVGGVSSQAALKAISDATSLAVQSATNVHRLDNRDHDLHREGPIVENSPAPRRPWFFGTAVGAIGVGAAVVGLANNAYYNAVFGHTTFESWQLGAMGFFIDAAAITLLPASTHLWKSHRLYALVAFAVWLGACVWSMNTTASFTAQLTGDLTAKRGSQISAATDAREQRSAAIDIAKQAINFARTKSDKAKATADLAKANATPIVAAPTITNAEGEHMFASAEQSRFVRITGLTVFPSLAGLFLTFAMLLLRRR